MSHSTVSRELKRNTGKRGYQYQQANKLAQQRHMFKNKSVKMNQVLKRLIKNCLALGWSHEQICGWLKANHIINLHHVSVYRYLLKREACYIHGFGIKADPTASPTATPTIVPGFLIVLILNKRSEAVNNREVFGHREADTMIGKAHQGAIVTIDERISKLRLAYPVKSKHKENVSAAIRAMLEPVAEAVDSITYDNGKEFSWHQQVNKSIKPKSPDRAALVFQGTVNPSFKFYGWSLQQILPRVLLKNRCSADCQC